MITKVSLRPAAEFSEVFTQKPGRCVKGQSLNPIVAGLSCVLPWSSAVHHTGLREIADSRASAEPVTPVCERSVHKGCRCEVGLERVRGSGVELMELVLD